MSPFTVSGAKVGYKVAWAGVISRLVAENLPRAVGQNVKRIYPQIGNLIAEKQQFQYKLFSSCARLIVFMFKDNIVFKLFVSPAIFSFITYYLFLLYL